MKVAVPVVGAEQQKAAAAQVAGRRMHHGQRKARGHGGVHRVAARLQHLNPCIGGEVMHLTTMPCRARTGCSSM